MFVGHFGVALAAKKAVPRVSLGTLFLAFQWADLLWPLLLLAGIEHVRIVPGITKATPLDFYDYPWSHSLVALVAWGILFGVIHWARRHDLAAALWLFGGVISHWFLDVAMHRTDMPVFPHGPYLGLGLWNSIPGTIVVEAAVYLVGIAVYVRATRPRDRVGVWSLWLLLGMLAALWVGATFAAPPPDTRTLALTGAVGGWLIFLPWGYWIDRHRVRRVTSDVGRARGEPLER